MSDSSIPIEEVPFFIQERVYVIPDKVPDTGKDSEQEIKRKPAQEPGDMTGRKLLILLQVSKDQLPDQLKTMLSNILQAIDVAVEETTILQIPSPDEINKTLQQHPCEKVICFGLPSDERDYYRWIKLAGKTQLLMADALSRLQQEVHLKKKLWSALQEVFKP